MTKPSNFINCVSNIRIRVLHPIFDLKHFRAAWKWTLEKPAWYRDSMKTWGMTKERYFENIKSESQIDFGVFNHSRLIAVFSFDEIAPTVFEIHLDCAKSADLETIIHAAKVVKQHGFEKGAVLGYVWVQSFNRPILKLYQQIGFLPSNISIFRGNYRGHPVEWRQFILTKPESVRV